MSDSGESEWSDDKYTNFGDYGMTKLPPRTSAQQGKTQPFLIVEDETTGDEVANEP